MGDGARELAPEAATGDLHNWQAKTIASRTDTLLGDLELEKEPSKVNRLQVRALRQHSVETAATRRAEQLQLVPT